MKMKKKYPNDYYFVPQTFLLEYEFNYFRNTLDQSNKIYIMKPVNSACGKGIKLVNRKDLKTA